MQVTRKLYISFISLIAVIAFAGCGTTGDDDSQTLSKYDTAQLLDFSKTNDYEVIVGSKESTVLRSVSHKSVSVDSSSSAWKNIADSVKNAIKTKKYSTRTYTDDGANVIYENREYGDISGYFDMRLVINKEDGSFTGSMDYHDYKSSEDGECEGNSISINGKLSVEGKYDLYNEAVNTMLMSVVDDVVINDIVFKDNFSIRIDYQDTNEDDAVLTLNGDIVQYGKNYGFKDYKLRSYPSEDNQYNYSYPISGNIYIFSDGIDGYFYVDTSYRHDLTPTKSDICQEHFYAGREKYIGDNSKLIFKIDSTDHYRIDIDYGDDGSVDKTIEGQL